MSAREMLTRIELPLALPVIVAGLRIATVTVISVAVVAAYVNAGGLGTLIFNGISNDHAPKIWAGALTACALAVAADLALARLERWLRRRRGWHDAARRRLAVHRSPTRDGSSARCCTHVALVGRGAVYRDRDRGAARRAGVAGQARAALAAITAANIGRTLPSLAVLALVDAAARHRFRAVAVRADAARAAADPDQHLHGDAAGRPRRRSTPRAAWA